MRSRQNGGRHEHAPSRPPPRSSPSTSSCRRKRLDDLRRRIEATRWPSKELVDDRSQGVQLATLKALADYWASEYDFGRVAERLNALPQFVTEIDGIDVHFIHVRSEHEDALPLIMTHGWPGSVIELLETIEPLTAPDNAEDAFHLVLPSVPGYGFSSEPTELGWWAGRVAQVWPQLMQRLGYTRYVAQGGDVGAAITDAMARLAPEGLIAHPHQPARDGAGRGAAADRHRRGEGRCQAGRRVQANRLRLLPRAGHAPADDRLRAAGLAGGARRLDARPRHRQLLQDLRRLRRRTSPRAVSPATTSSTTSRSTG